MTSGIVPKINSEDRMARGICYKKRIFSLVESNLSWAEQGRNGGEGAYLFCGSDQAPDPGIEAIANKNGIFCMGEKQTGNPVKSGYRIATIGKS